MQRATLLWTRSAALAFGLSGANVLVVLLFVLDSKYLMTLVGAAMRANKVRLFVFAALIAAHEVIQGQLVMTATIEFASARQFALG